jgi:hypothetical protein
MAHPSGASRHHPHWLGRVQRAEGGRAGGGRYKVAPDDSGVYDDTQTRAQYNARQFQDIDDDRQANKIPTVTPPSMETDAELPTRVIDADEYANRAMGANPDAPASYGAGKNKIYSPKASEDLLEKQWPSQPDMPLSSPDVKSTED